MKRARIGLLAVALGCAGVMPAVAQSLSAAQIAQVIGDPAGWLAASGGDAAEAAIKAWKPKQ